MAPKSEEQYVFSSSAEEGSFEIYPDPRGNTLGRGTEITLILKDDASEYLDSVTLSTLVYVACSKSFYDTRLILKVVRSTPDFLLRSLYTCGEKPPKKYLSRNRSLKRSSLRQEMKSIRMMTKLWSKKSTIKRMRHPKLSRLSFRNGPISMLPHQSGNGV